MGQFEKDLERLEFISAALRGSDIDLEEAGKLFEEGVLLAQRLEKELNNVERKVEVLVNKPSVEGEKPVLELFPELGDITDR